MTTTATVTDIATLEKDLNGMILSGKAMEAFEALYSEDVVMRDNDDEPWTGKDFNRKREEEFFGSVAEVHAIELLTSAAGDDVSFSEWTYDITFKNGYRATWNQTAVRRWKDGQIVAERFYHKTLG